MEREAFFAIVDEEQVLYYWRIIELDLAPMLVYQLHNTAPAHMFELRGRDTDGAAVKGVQQRSSVFMKSSRSTTLVDRVGWEDWISLYPSPHEVGLCLTYIMLLVEDALKVANMCT